MLVRISVGKYAALPARLCLSTAYGSIALMLNYHDFFSFFSALTFDVRLTLLIGTVIVWAIWLYAGLHSSW